MSNESVVHDEDSQTRNTPDIFQSVCTLQEHHPAEAFTILQAFLHLNSPFNHREYPNDFVCAQLALLKRLSPSSLLSLNELLKQFVPRSEWIQSLNVIRKHLVDVWITQFRKEYQKQKWSGNGEKIQTLTSLIERSLNLFDTNASPTVPTTSMWYSTVLQLFQPIIDELNEYLKNKLNKQQQTTPTLPHLLKTLGQLCEQLNKIDEKSSCLIVHDYFRTILLANLQQRIDFILNKKILDHFESVNKLEAYTCPNRHITFLVHPEFAKLLTLLKETSVRNHSVHLFEKCNEQLEALVEKVSNLLLMYPSTISLEHCIYLLSSLSGIARFLQQDQYEYLLHKFCQFLLTYWQVTLLHDCDAEDWLNNKSYFESTRYSVYIDTLFHHFTRFHSFVQHYCASLLSIVVPFMLLELMHFIYQRYASITISYARQNQYKIDLLAFLVHASEYAHYFLVRRTSSPNFVLFSQENIQTRFFQYGNELLTAVSLVTCPIHILYEELQDIDQYRKIFPSKMTWLNVIRPDWFEIDHEEIRPNVLIFLTIKHLLETRDNDIPLHHLLPFIVENAQFNLCRVPLMHLMMRSEQWCFIDTFVKQEHDWSFLNGPSTKAPEWLSSMMKYWQVFFLKCCSLCASEKEIPWQTKLQSEMDPRDRFDEKTLFLKSLAHYLANLPLSLHHLLQAISQHQSPVNKRQIFAHLLHKFMVEHKIDRASIYYSFLTEQENSAHSAIERLLDRKSLLLRDPHDRVQDEQTDWQNSQHIYSILHEHVDIIRSRLDVKRLDEAYNISPSYPQSLSQQQRRFAQSTENLQIDSTKSNVTFMDFNPLTSKRSVEATNATLKIDYTLVNRVELEWAPLFSNLVVQLKSNVIYHLVTLRFELQSSLATLLNDAERTVVGKLLELLPRFVDARK